MRRFWIELTRLDAGKLDKVIADELRISMRTVEVQRAQVYAKLGARSAAEMATLLVLACADGRDDKDVASRQRVTAQTVSNRRGRCVEHRLGGLLDAPRSRAPRTIDDAREWMQ